MEAGLESDRCSVSHSGYDCGMTKVSDVVSQAVLGPPHEIRAKFGGSYIPNDIAHQEARDREDLLHFAGHLEVVGNGFNSAAGHRRAHGTVHDGCEAGKEDLELPFSIPIVWVLRIVRCEGDDLLRRGSCDLEAKALVCVGGMECFV